MDESPSNRCISPKYLWQRAFMAYARQAHTPGLAAAGRTWNPVKHPRSTSRLPLININFVEKIVPNGSRDFGAGLPGQSLSSSLSSLFFSVVFFFAPSKRDQERNPVSAFASARRMNMTILMYKIRLPEMRRNERVCGLLNAERSERRGRGETSNANARCEHGETRFDER